MTRRMVKSSSRLINFDRSGSWWAASAATYCPGSMAVCTSKIHINRRLFPFFCVTTLYLNYVFTGGDSLTKCPRLQEGKVLSDDPRRPHGGRGRVHKNGRVANGIRPRAKRDVVDPGALGELDVTVMLGWESPNHARTRIRSMDQKKQSDTS